MFVIRRKLCTIVVNRHISTRVSSSSQQKISLISNLKLRNKQPQTTTISPEQEDSWLKLPTRPTEYKNCDKEILQKIKSKQLDQLYNEVLRFEKLKQYPSRKTLNILASIFASRSEFNNIAEIKRICEKKYPQEYKWMMGYEHYKAEALWKAGQFEEAIALFEDLFSKNPEQRGKICDMSVFMIKQVFSKSLVSVYSRLTDFADFCAKKNHYSPLLNLWASSFVARDHNAWLIGEELAKKHGSIPEKAGSKIEKIISKAYETANVDILQRLIQFVLTYELTKWRGRVLAALLNFQCENEDLTGALETFQYSSSMKIILPATVVQRLLNELHKEKRQVPQMVLYAKYGQMKPSSLKFRW